MPVNETGAASWLVPTTEEVPGIGGAIRQSTKSRRETTRKNDVLVFSVRPAQFERLELCVSARQIKSPTVQSLQERVFDQYQQTCECLGRAVDAALAYYYRCLEMEHSYRPAVRQQDSKEVTATQQNVPASNPR